MRAALRVRRRLTLLHHLALLCSRLRGSLLLLRCLLLSPLLLHLHHLMLLRPLLLGSLHRLALLGRRLLLRPHLLLTSSLLRLLLRSLLLRRLHRLALMGRLLLLRTHLLVAGRLCGLLLGSLLLRSLLCALLPFAGGLSGLLSPLLLDRVDRPSPTRRRRWRGCSTALAGIGRSSPTRLR